MKVHFPEDMNTSTLTGPCRQCDSSTTCWTNEFNTRVVTRILKKNKTQKPECSWWSLSLKRLSTSSAAVFKSQTQAQPGWILVMESYGTIRPSPAHLRPGCDRCCPERRCGAAGRSRRCTRPSASPRPPASDTPWNKCFHDAETPSGSCRSLPTTCAQTCASQTSGRMLLRVQIHSPVF